MRKHLNKQIQKKAERLVEDAASQATLLGPWEARLMEFTENPTRVLALLEKLYWLEQFYGMVGSLNNVATVKKAALLFARMAVSADMTRNSGWTSKVSRSPSKPKT